MGFLAGKRLLITGVLNNRSIAYGIARACHREGAELAFSYVGERFKDRITEFAADFGSKLIFDCDVGDDAQIEKLFADLGQHWDQFDGFVHAIAFAPREAIAGTFLEGLSRENFRIAHDISAYSFPALAKAVRPTLARGSSIVGLDFDASVAWPAYDWMGVAKAALESASRYLARDLGPEGVRVNLVAAGPLRTVAARSIPGFRQIDDVWQERAPLGWDVDDAEPTARAVVALLSDWFPATTGEIVHVDGGAHAIGAPRPAASRRCWA